MQGGREGSSLVIACTARLTCPVSMMGKCVQGTVYRGRYFCVGSSLDPTPIACVYRNISVTEEEERKTGGLGYIRQRESLLKIISLLFFKPKSFGMPSYHVGDITAAVNGGLPGRLTGMVGNLPQDGYIEDLIERHIQLGTYMYM